MINRFIAFGDGYPFLMPYIESSAVLGAKAVKHFNERLNIFSNSQRGFIRSINGCGDNSTIISEIFYDVMSNGRSLYITAYMHIWLMIVLWRKDSLTNSLSLSRMSIQNPRRTFSLIKSHPGILTWKKAPNKNALFLLGSSTFSWNNIQNGLQRQLLDHIFNRRSKILYSSPFWRHYPVFWNWNEYE